MIIMKNLEAIMQDINTREYNVNNNKLNQVQRNETKRQILEAIGKDLPAGILIGRCAEGLVIEVPNEIEGAITFILDIKIKSLDYDGVLAVQSYKQDQTEKAARREKRARDRAASYKTMQARKAKQ